MEWHLLGLSFITVFLSELGDKSQLAAIALSGRGRSVKAVFLGTAAALVLASLLGVLLGGGLSQILPVRWVKGVAAIGFAVMAVKLLRGGGEEEDESSAAESAVEP
ncbi:TMEM165/GDT1 family protein [Leptolyngbya ohadii]|uniref:TMEM165/GDT1 family protein n=1 Tax=Leptolyngbya ohadii TaxID=1962290 RepID=UPI000B599916|nr:TMEM165/GDT1 family protein [Leptolyngbya ohadii]